MRRTKGFWAKPGRNNDRKPPKDNGMNRVDPKKNRRRRNLVRQFEQLWAHRFDESKGTIQ